MGVAGGWFVLGIGWIVERERSSSRPTAQPHPRGAIKQGEEEEATVVFGSRGKGRARSQVNGMGHDRIPKEVSSTEMSSENLSGSGTGETEESSIAKTPGAHQEASDMVKREGGVERESEQLKLLVGSPIEDLAFAYLVKYDLLQTLLHLYRDGHIQSQDPVALPPISQSQLPSVLQPQGDLEKGRNVWHLGGVVANSLLSLPLVQEIIEGARLLGPEGAGRKRDQGRMGVAVMAHYIVGLLSLSLSWIRRLITRSSG